jgi:hypothetical protein
MERAGAAAKTRDLTRDKTRALPGHARWLPYLISWGVLAVVMIIGMKNVPTALYTPIDGDWAKWNAEAILHFGKLFDLSTYSMLTGMGSMQPPNLPWLNPGALAVALPFSRTTTSIVSYAVYGAELAISSLLLARALGFSWLTANAAAQLHLFLMFPPFSQALYIYDWYALVPYYAHLLTVLNLAAIVLLACGRTQSRARNVALCVAFPALFICGLLSAAFTFVFATPAYVVICAAVILARKPRLAEWAWKIVALALCLVVFFGSGLLDYYLGTIATAGRSPDANIVWSKLLSVGNWVRIFREHSVCEDPRLLLCFKDRGAWLHVLALTGGCLALIMRRGDVRTVAGALIGYVGFVHLYAYAFQNGLLGWLSVVSSHFMMLSCLCFLFICAVFPFTEAAWLAIPAKPRSAIGSRATALANVALNVALLALLAVTVVALARSPYLGLHSYRPVRLATAVAVLAMLVVAAAGLSPRLATAILGTATPGGRLRHTAVVSVLPIFAVVHLLFNFHLPYWSSHDPSLRNYLQDNAGIEVGQPFRGYVTTIWLDPTGQIVASGPAVPFDPEAARYINGRSHFWLHYGESFTETDLWRWRIPTIEEYGEWTSAQAHAFFMRLLAPRPLHIHSNYLRAYIIDSDILRLLGVRFVITDAQALDQPAPLRTSLAAPGALTVRVFELSNPNLGTYSPTQFAKAATADAMMTWIRDNKHRLDQMAVVAEDVAPTQARARNVAITVQRDGIRVRAQSDGPAHIVLPVQFSHCLVVTNGAAVQLRRANLIQTLMSFRGTVDADIEFRFGLFADNKCRLRDGADNKALGL